MQAQIVDDDSAPPVAVAPGASQEVVQATLQPSTDLAALFGRMPSSFGSLPDELLF